MEKAKNDYIEGDKKLDEIASKYARGKNALSGRSINVSDINKITKISEEYLKKLETDISYYWGKDKEPITINEKNNNKTTIKIEHDDEFLWFNTDKNEWNISKKNGNETNDNMKKITTLKNTHITYNFEIYDSKLKEYIPIMKKYTKKYNMLFKDDEGKKALYWTSTKFANVTENYVAYGYNVVKSDDLNYNLLVYSNLTSRQNKFGVRPVIEIK